MTPSRNVIVSVVTALFVVAACAPRAVRPEAPPVDLVEAEPEAPPEEVEPEPVESEALAAARAEDDADEEALAAAMSPYDRARIMMLEQSMVRFREQADEIYGLLRQAVAEDPDNAEIIYNQAIFYERLGRYDDAIALLRRAVSLSPEMSNAHARLGVLLLDRGQQSEGEAALRRAREISPQDPVVHVSLAGRQIEHGNYEEAIAHARTALLSDSEDMNAYLALAISYYHLEQNELGILVLGNGLELNPHAAPLHNLYGLFLLRSENVRGAIASFRRAVQEDPALLDAHMNLGAAMLANGDYATAKQHFEIVLAAEPDNLDALISRGVASRGLGRYDEARQDYERVLASDSGRHEARYNLCILYQHYVEDYDQAYAACSDYLERLNRRDRRYREMQRRVDGLRDTIKILRDMPSS